MAEDPAAWAAAETPDTSGSATAGPRARRAKDRQPAPVTTYGRRAARRRALHALQPLAAPAVQPQEHRGLIRERKQSASPGEWWGGRIRNCRPPPKTPTSTRPATKGETSTRSSLAWLWRESRLCSTYDSTPEHVQALVLPEEPRSEACRGGDRIPHMPQLGVPADVRQQAKASGQRNDIWAWYDEHVLTQFTKNVLVLQHRQSPIAMMCLERDPDDCHGSGWQTPWSDKGSCRATSRAKHERSLGDGAMRLPMTPEQRISAGWHTSGRWIRSVETPYWVEKLTGSGSACEFEPPHATPSRADARVRRPRGGRVGDSGGRVGAASPDAGIPRRAPHS